MVVQNKIYYKGQSQRSLRWSFLARVSVTVVTEGP